MRLFIDAACVVGAVQGLCNVRPSVPSIDSRYTAPRVLAVD